MRELQKDYFVNKFLKEITDYNHKYLIGIDFDSTLSYSNFPVSALPGPEVEIDILPWINDILDTMFFSLTKDGVYANHLFDVKNNYITKISVVDIVKYWVTKGDQFILWTCRTPTLYSWRDALQDAIDWSKERGIEYVAHNANHPAVLDDPRKILVDRVIDDNAINIFDTNNWNQNNWVQNHNDFITTLEIIEQGKYSDCKPKERK